LEDKRPWLAALFDWVAPVAIKISKPPAILRREEIRREVSGCGQASPWPAPAPGAGAPPELLFTAPHLELSASLSATVAFPPPLSLLPLAHGHRPLGLGRTPQATGFTGGGDTTPAPARRTELGGACAAV